MCLTAVAFWRRRSRTLPAFFLLAISALWLVAGGYCPGQQRVNDLNSTSTMPRVATRRKFKEFRAHYACEMGPEARPRKQPLLPN